MCLNQQTVCSDSKRFSHTRNLEFYLAVVKSIYSDIWPEISVHVSGAGYGCCNVPQLEISLCCGLKSIISLTFSVLWP